MIAAQQTKSTTQTHQRTPGPVKGSTAPQHTNKSSSPATPSRNPASGNFNAHRDFRDRHLERAGFREDIRGVRDIDRGAALIKEGQKIGGAQGAALEQRGQALEMQGSRDIRKGDAMINHANREMMPLPVRTSPPKPEPITKRSEFVWDHRSAPSPTVDDRGIHINATPITQAPDARTTLDDPKWADTVNRLEKEELVKDTHQWHYDSGNQYSHYLDRWGDHWYGFYGHDSSYYWVRHHEGHFWWHDDKKNQWNYWHDGSWWSQDPHSSKAVPVNSNARQTSSTTPSNTNAYSMNQANSSSSSGGSTNSDASNSSDSTQSDAGSDTASTKNS